MYYKSVIIHKNRIFPYFQNKVKKLNKYNKNNNDDDGDDDNKTKNNLKMSKMKRYILL